MGYSYRKYAGFLLIALAAAIIIRILPLWAWCIAIILFLGSILFLLFNIFRW